MVVQIRRGSQVLKPWYGCVLAEEASVSDVFSDYSGGILDSGPPIPEECGGYVHKKINIKSARLCQFCVPILKKIGCYLVDLA